MDCNAHENYIESKVVYIMRFLRGINDQYSGIRSIILLMDPFPLINRDFHSLSNKRGGFLVKGTRRLTYTCRE